jgi:hypothetical protein
MAWVKQNWLALSSFVISVAAFVLSYRKYRHDTRPVLVVRRGQTGIEIENLGRGIAVGVSATLLERSKRPSATLHVQDVIKPDITATLSAGDYPEELRTEMEKAPFFVSYEQGLRLISGDPILYSPSQIATYLLTRDTNAVLLVRFRVLDGSKTLVRIFAPKRTDRDFIELVPWPRVFRNRLSAWVLGKRYAGNAILGPPPAFLRARQSGPEAGKS